MKKCPSCGEYKNKKGYVKDLSNVGGLHWECRECGRLRSKKYSKKGIYMKKLYFQRHYGDPDKMPKQFIEVCKWLDEQLYR